MKHLDKKSLIRPISALLGAAVVLSSAVTAIAVTSGKKNNTEKTAAASEEKAETLSSKAEKNETVYVIAGADGSVEKIIVSDWIKNSLNAAKLTDKSELKDAENVKGDETYTMSSDNMKVWDAQGNDIYYKGSIDKELPVKLSVSYKLDGKEISPDKLAGKSGKVTVRYDYSNNQYETVNIDGKEEKIYVPFAMLTGMLLDNDVFTNIEVTNGKVINDGDHSAVAGIAFPGLQSNLNISKDKLNIPDYVEITADVKNFKMSNTVTIAANNLFNEIDTSKVNSVSELEEQLSKVTSAMTQLTDGSSQLYSGLVTLLGKSDELIAGVNKLAAGLSELTSQNGNLTSGATQVFNGLLDNAYQTITSKGITINNLTIENYSTVLNNLVASPDATQTSQLVGIAKTSLNAALANAGVPESLYDVATFVLYQQYASNPQITQAQALEAVKTVMQNDTLRNQAILTFNNLGAQGQMAINGLRLTLAKSTLKPEIDAALSKLDGYKELYEGIYKYTAGVSQVESGVNELSSKLPALKSGVGQLKDGAGSLNDGLKQFNEQGIKKITDLANGDVRNLVVRAKATVDVSKNYKSFSGISDEMDGSVKFVYKTDSIKADK